jgi:peptide-methionine (R)-S-oxide reductase
MSSSAANAAADPAAYTTEPLGSPSEDLKRVVKTDAGWRAQLSAEEYRVLRGKGTEAHSSGIYDKETSAGVYVCRACEAPLYTSEAKFQAGCGWPAFDKCIAGAIKTERDDTLGHSGRARTEILCAACDGHLGHVFTGEQYTDTDTRHCVNSVSVKLLRHNK